MKVLIVCMYMSGRHGSVLHALEYGKFFKSMGSGNEVYIGSIFIDSEIRKLAEDAGINLMRVSNIPTDAEWDLVYALHLFLFPYLLFKGLKYKRSILALLSVEAPLEQLPPSCIWPYFDLITAISPEIIQRYNSRFGIDLDLFTLIPNPAPLEFVEKSINKQDWAQSIHKIAVVSNHHVQELEELGKIAPWITDYFGSEYGNSVDINPDLLLDYDVIITIGKTAQYGMSLGIPVFEYDHAGGCGYLTPANIEAEALTNFSGRSTRRKLDAKGLAEELAAGYPEAAGQAASLRKIALEKFSIVRLVTKQLKLLATKPPREKTALTTDAWFFANSCYLAVDHILGLMRIRKEA